MNDSNEKRLLILGSLDEFVELVKMSRARGYYTVVCDGYENGPAKVFADKFYTIDVREVDKIVDMCKTEKINGIIGSFSDLLFEQITKIAAKMNLKWYVLPENLKYYREKNEARSLLRKLGVSVPKSTTLNKDFTNSELNGFSFPLVIKPINGYGSKGIFVVHSIQEIRDRFDEVVFRSNMNNIQAEEYINGKEFNMMTWVCDGNIYVISIANREKNPQEGNSIPLLNRIVYPAREIKDVIGSAKDVLQKFADFTKQKDGPLSMQFFYNTNGIEVCEIAGRFFGYEHEMVTYCSGFKIEDLLLDYVYESEKVKKRLEQHSPFFQKYVEGIYFVGTQNAEIKDLSAARNLQKHISVLESTIFYNEGDKIDNYGLAPYLARYYLIANSREEIDNITQFFFDNFEVLDNYGNNLAKKFFIETPNFVRHNMCSVCGGGSMAMTWGGVQLYSKIISPAFRSCGVRRAA